MPKPSATERFSDFLRRIYTLQDSASLARVICDRLPRLIPAENIFIGDHDMRATRINSCLGRHLFSAPDFLPIVNTCAGEHPLWAPIRTGGQIVRCLSDFAGRRAWEATNLFNLALRADGIQDHLSIEFGDRRNRITSVGVFRDRRGFSESEVALMTRLIPHIEQALQNARAAEASGMFRGVVDGEVRPLILAVGLDGRISEWTGEARQLVARFFPAEPGTGSRDAPPTLDRWLRRSMDLLNRGAAETRVTALRIRSGLDLLEGRLLRNRDQPGAWLLLQGFPGLRLPAPRPLSVREREVLAWVREGKTNDEISRCLGCGTETVKTHLKRTFAKLGVDNRLAAVRRYYLNPA